MYDNVSRNIARRRSATVYSSCARARSVVDLVKIFLSSSLNIAQNLVAVCCKVWVYTGSS